MMRNRLKCPDSVTLLPLWRRHSWRLITALVVASGVVCARSASRPAQTDDRSRYHERTFRVTRVVDGDTFDIGAADGNSPTTRIRLWGVDTPEVARGERGGMYFGAEASAFAKRTLEGRSVRVMLSPRRTRGKFGRLLAYVFLESDEKMFNELLLEEGFAYADFRFEHHYMDRFKSIEKHARRRGAGLWKDVTREQMPPWRQRFERKRSGPQDD